MYTIYERSANLLLLIPASREDVATSAAQRDMQLMIDDAFLWRATRAYQNAYRTVFSCEPCGLPDEVEGGDGAIPAPNGFFTRSRVGSSTKVA